MNVNISLLFLLLSTILLFQNCSQQEGSEEFFANSNWQESISGDNSTPLAISASEDSIFATVVANKTYFISPSGKDTNSGLSTSLPLKTFAYALKKMVCGDTLTLLNGIYGDGTSTGRLVISGRNCSATKLLKIRAYNPRQARIHDSGNAYAITITGSSYIDIDGLVASSADLKSGAEGGGPVYVYSSHHVNLRKMLLRNPNRYKNRSLALFVKTSYSLVEDLEGYNFHRHGVTMKDSSNNVNRRIYCNPRTGGLAGGYANGNGTAGGDACVALYPCTNCIVENAIADGTSKKLWLLEIDAYATSSGNKILGSIGYKTNMNGIYINSRGTGIAKMPTNTTIENVAFFQHSGPAVIKSQSAKNTVVRNVTMIGNSSEQVGLKAFKSDSLPGDGICSLTAQNVLAYNMDLVGFSFESSLYSWNGSHLNSYRNAGYTPVSSSRLTAIKKIDPNLGSCIAWIPSSSPMKRAGASGKDIGANVLYRYKNGVVTTERLWDKATGRFPCGAIVSGVNNIAGNSCNDVHVRLNINRNGCVFPSGY